MNNKSISRRAVAKGAAWGAPVVAVGAAAPVMAASLVPVVRGSSYYFDTFDERVSPKTIDGAVRPASSEGGCSYTVVNGPATVSNLSVTYWLPLASYTFSAVSASPWSALTRDASQGTRVGPTTGLTYYAYTTKYAGTGDPSTTCGPTYSFTAPAVSTNITNPGGSYFYQLSYTLNGTAMTNPVQSVKNP